MNKKGFTLIEIIVTLILLSIITFIAGINITKKNESFDINSINKNVESMFRMSSNIHNSNSMQPINLSIGDIQVHGVQDVNGLANAIANQLPNTLLQTMTKRK